MNYKQTSFNMFTMIRSFFEKKWVFPTMIMVNRLPSMTGWFETLGKARKRSQFSRGDWLMKAMLGPVFWLPKKHPLEANRGEGGHVVGRLVDFVFLVECCGRRVTFCLLNSCHFDMPILLVIIGGESCYPPVMFIILVGESKKSKKLRELQWLGVYPYWFAIIILEISEDNSPKIGCRAR